MQRVEGFDQAGFRFEGYNVYQLPPSRFPNIRDGVKLATFDLKNDVSTIVQEEFDPEAGVIIRVPEQTGSNSGIVRSLLIEDDEINRKPLSNGREYTFAVTAYSYHPDPLAAVKSLESAPATVTVQPQAPDPGVTLRGTIGDTLPVTPVPRATLETGHEIVNVGGVHPIVIDPTKITGDDYKVVFSGDEDQEMLFWHLINVTRGDTVLKNQTNLQSFTAESGCADFHVGRRSGEENREEPRGSILTLESAEQSESNCGERHLSRAH